MRGVGRPRSEAITGVEPAVERRRRAGQSMIDLIQQLLFGETRGEEGATQHHDGDKTHREDHSGAQ